MTCFFFFSSRRRHTRFSRDWSSDVCSSDLGAGGIDELSPVGPNFVCEVVDGEVHEREIDPEVELGVPRCSVEELRGGSPAENAAAIREVFGGAEGGRRSAILLNAAGA